MSQLANTLQALGLNEETVHTGVWKAGAEESPAYLSTRPEFPSLLRPTIITLQKLEDLQAVIGTTDSPTLTDLQLPAAWPVENADLTAKELDGEQEVQVYQALLAALTGHQAAVESYAEILAKRYFPMKLGVFAAEDIVVQAGQQLIIEPQGHDPVVVTCNSITLEPGAQIVCEAPVIMNVETFVKQTNAQGAN
ncbi:hypothetical protein [Tumebacillus permanentifrigoris]|uniref:Uncharacterized protein n=1 Tax=Tumebacillus permanentifrigoris TaxID=378543 RepID=A0A316D841_9BACL|nr:hypothetical protein [Tumebacillus permanentifrigoris]PWK11601.1 hypothetical protein C7459_110130 [Tumebacillus permanentifrigoris]